MKLFAVCVGGDHPRANIEVHDIRFVVADSLEATFAQLRLAWWGRPASLHVDGYAILDQADGWDIQPVRGPAPQAGEPRLWFVNLGGYTPGLFGEQHNYLFLVGAERAGVWRRARLLSPEWSGRHKDNLASIDSLVDIHTVMEDQGWQLKLSQAVSGSGQVRVVSDYIRI